MSKIVGIGTDLCEIERMRELLHDDRFLQRYFDSTEIQYIHQRGAAAAESLAGCFAAKEAFTKAAKTGIAFPFREIGVRHDENGAPYYELSGTALESARNCRTHLSISHDGGVAIAFCILESV